MKDACSTDTRGVSYSVSGLACSLGGGGGRQQRGPLPPTSTPPPPPPARPRQAGGPAAAMDRAPAPRARPLLGAHLRTALSAYDARAAAPPAFTSTATPLASPLAETEMDDEPAGGGASDGLRGDGDGEVG
jgi:hypothetical protein